MDGQSLPYIFQTDQSRSKNTGIIKGGYREISIKIFQICVEIQIPTTYSLAQENTKVNKFFAGKKIEPNLYRENRDGESPIVPGGRIDGILLKNPPNFSKNSPFFCGRRCLTRMPSCDMIYNNIHFP